MEGGRGRGFVTVFVMIVLMSFSLMIFFFQAEDGIRDKLVTGVQTCALPICAVLRRPRSARWRRRHQEDQLRSVERRDATGQTVPGVLAHEQRRASPRRLERAHLSPAFDEALLVDRKSVVRERV